MLRRLLYLVAVLAVVYGAGVGYLWAIMLRPPVEFSAAMARIPRPAMRVLPFAPLWARARAGALQEGDPAPDFDLERLDKTSRVRLSAFRGSRPVVLIFGSYT
ncbi:MAG: hypothetical protein FJW40_11790 [Acidobacteria bacterium]|nr:hypothetical protein [Acidobacteriota bacterium]